jgi:hypothetical protein
MFDSVASALLLLRREANGFSFSYTVTTTFDIAQRDKAPVHVVYTSCINLDAEMCDSVS